MLTMTGELWEVQLATSLTHTPVPADVRPGERMGLLTHAIRNQFAVRTLPVKQCDSMLVRFDLQ